MNLDEVMQQREEREKTSHAISEALGSLSLWIFVGVVVLLIFG